MPSRNSIKQFKAEKTYHVYNRGVGKINVFVDAQDYAAFLRRLQLMLLPQSEADKLQHNDNRIRIANYSERIDFLAFCLMPNHFHFMLWQSDSKAITQFMHTLSTSYSMYFNRKYKRVGPLFQGRFKAVPIGTDSYLIHLSRYIHCNPKVFKKDIYTYPYSSLRYYFESFSPKWLSAQQVQEQFENKEEYVEFINNLGNFKVAEEEFSLD